MNDTRYIRSVKKMWSSSSKCVAKHFVFKPTNWCGIMVFRPNFLLSEHYLFRLSRGNSRVNCFGNVGQPADRSINGHRFTIKNKTIIEEPVGEYLFSVDSDEQSRMVCSPFDGTVNHRLKGVKK